MLRRRPQLGGRYAGTGEIGRDGRTLRIPSDAADEGDPCACPGRCDGLVRALAARTGVRLPAEHRLARRRQGLDPQGQVHVGRAQDDDVEVVSRLILAHPIHLNKCDPSRP